MNFRMTLSSKCIDLTDEASAFEIRPLKLFLAYRPGLRSIRCSVPEKLHFFSRGWWLCPTPHKIMGKLIGLLNPSIRSCGLWTYMYSLTFLKFWNVKYRLVHFRNYWILYKFNDPNYNILFLKQEYYLNQLWMLKVSRFVIF